MVGFWRRCCCCRRRALAREAVSDGFLTPNGSEASFASLAELDPELSSLGSEASRRHLCSELARAARLAAAAVPGGSGRLPAADRGQWYDCGSPGQARCWVWIKKGGARPESKVVIEAETADTVDSLPLIRPLPPASASGALLALLEVGSWPKWMPMCQEANILKRWGPAEILVRVDFKLPVVGLHLGCDAFICLVDRLEEEGCVEVLCCSAGSPLASGLCARTDASRELSGTSSSSQSFLGVALRPFGRRWLQVQADVDVSSLRFWPLDDRGLKHRACFVMSGEEKSPVHKITCQIWRMFSRNIVTLLANRNRDAHVEIEPAQLAFYERLEQRIMWAGARAAAPQSGV